MQLVVGNVFAGLVGSLCTGPGDVSWESSFVVLFFEDVLLQVVTMEYLGLYKQILQVLVRHLSHPSLY